MEGILPQLLLVAVLVLANAAFAGSEMALVSRREGQLQRLEASGGSGQVLARLAREPNRFLATIQIGSPWPGSWRRPRPPCRWPSRWRARSDSWAGRPARWRSWWSTCCWPTSRSSSASSPRKEWPCSGPSAGACWRPGPWLCFGDHPPGGVDAVTLDEPGGALDGRRPEAPTRGGERGGAEGSGRYPPGIQSSPARHPLRGPRDNRADPGAGAAAAT